MKKILLSVLCSALIANTVFAATDTPAEAPKLTQEQLDKIKELVNADIPNWEALGDQDFVARDDKGEVVTGVKAIIHTKKSLEEFKQKIKGQPDEKTAKMLYEIEKSKVIILQCDKRVAEVHSIVPANDKVPAIGQAQALNIIQVDALAQKFCNK